jgi:hypothetical protein
MGAILKEIISLKPWVVDIPPCCTPEFKEVIDLSRMIKKRLGKVKIIVVSTHPTLYPEIFFQ